MGSPGRRRLAIRELVRTQSIATQEHLRQLLLDRGFDVTQATLSRDLARLGARHVSMPDGGTIYELEELRAPPPSDPFLRVAGIVRHVRDNGSLVVVHTEPGAAQAIARSIDMARLPGVLGSLAGDDTVFVAPTRSQGARRLRLQLEKLFTAKEVSN